MKKLILSVAVSSLVGCASAPQTGTIYDAYHRECGGGSILKAWMFKELGLEGASLNEQRRMSHNNDNCYVIKQFMSANNIPFPASNTR